MYLHPTKGYRGHKTIQTKSNRRRKYIPSKKKPLDWLQRQIGQTR